MNIYTALARKTIQLYLTKNKLPDLKKVSPQLLNKRRGCFVSIHNKSDHALRGCIGTILAVYKNLAAEIASNAVAAAIGDPRFAPVAKEEIDNLEISVDVLSDPEPIDSEKMLNPKKYGAIVKSPDGRTGLLLPDIEGVETVKEQIAICRQKAGINNNEPILLYRFTVERHRE